MYIFINMLRFNFTIKLHCRIFLFMLTVSYVSISILLKERSPMQRNVVF